MIDLSRNDQLVLVAYAATLDGFILLPKKTIRNPESPFLVCMQQWTFEVLATHASREGEFFIPASQELDSFEKLRMLVVQKETPFP